MKGALWQTMTDPSQMKTEHFGRIAELTAEVVVRRLSEEQIQPLRKDVTHLRESFARLNAVIFNGGSGGLVNRFDAMENNCSERHKKLDDMISEKRGSKKLSRYLMGIAVTLIIAVLTGIAVNYYDNRDEAHLRQQQTVNK